MACPARGLEKLLWFQAVIIAIAAGTAFILSGLHHRDSQGLPRDTAFVEVVDAVGQGRVYVFDELPCVLDALAAAGVKGHKVGGDQQVLKSGSALFVMPDSTIRRGFMTGGHLIDLGIPIPINNADGTDLEAIPGIGPALGARIVLDRVSKGPFRDLADLTRVKGIGPAKAALLKEYVSF